MRNETELPSPEELAANGGHVPTHTHSGLTNAELLERLRVLEEGKIMLEERQHIDTQLAALANRMRLNPGQHLGEWADALLADVIEAANGLQAILFLRTEDGAGIQKLGSYACPEGTPEYLLLGEGITGQAAKTGQMVLLTDGSAFRSVNQSGLATIEAKALLVLPLVYNNAVEGLLEISSFSLFRNRDLELLKALAPSLGASLNTVRSQHRIQRLLAEAQTRSEALEVQEEELRQNLEELQATQEQMRSAQQESENQRNYIRALLDNNQDSIMAYDQNLNLVLFNSAAVRRFKEVNNIELRVGQTVKDLLPEDKMTVFLPMLHRVLAGEVVQFESTMKLRNADTGQVEDRYFDITYTPFFSAEGANAGCLSVSRDVTRRKTAELEVQRKVTEVQQVLEGVQTGLLLSDSATGIIRLANSRIAEILGVSVASLVGHATPSFYANPEDRTALLAELKTNGVVTNRSLRIVRPDKTHLWARVSVRMVEMDGTPCLISTFEDITLETESAT